MNVKSRTVTSGTNIIGRLSDGSDRRVINYTHYIITVSDDLDNQYTIIFDHDPTELEIETQYNIQLLTKLNEMTLDELKTYKINQIRTLCNKTITTEFYSSVKGTSVQYGLDLDDQINIGEIWANIKDGIYDDSNLEYYTKSQPCASWTVAEFTQFYFEAMAFKSANIKRSKQIIANIGTMTVREDILAVSW